MLRSGDVGGERVDARHESALLRWVVAVLHDAHAQLHFRYGCQFRDGTQHIPTRLRDQPAHAARGIHHKREVEAVDFWFEGNALA